MSNGTFIQIGAENFDRPALELCLEFLKQDHGERVGFFSRGASRAPDSELLRGKLRFCFDDSWQGDFLDCVQLRAVRKKQVSPTVITFSKTDEVGLPHGLTVKQS